MSLVLLLLWATACSVHHAAMDLSKLDPAFAALIAEKNRSEQRQKHYDCIVYTKQAAVLRKKGIVINSELPGFVTAWATLKQIEQMASMPEVTYIEAPRTNLPTQQAQAP